MSEDDDDTNYADGHFMDDYGHFNEDETEQFIRRMRRKHSVTREYDGYTQDDY